MTRLRVSDRDGVGWRRIAGRRGGQFGFPVDELFQLLARLEVRNLLRRDVDFVAGSRIATLARLPLAQPEAAESAQLDFLAAVQRVDDAFEDGVDNDFGVLLRQVGHPRNFLDEFRLGHAAASHAGLLAGSWLSAPGS